MVEFVWGQLCAFVSQDILEQGANRVYFVQEVYIENKRANLQPLKNNNKPHTNWMINIQKHLLLKRTVDLVPALKKTQQTLLLLNFKDFSFWFIWIQVQ